MNASNTLKKLGIEQTFNYIYKDPDKNMIKIMDWADKFAEGQQLKILPTLTIITFAAFLKRLILM